MFSGARDGVAGLLLHHDGVVRTPRQSSFFTWATRFLYFDTQTSTVCKTWLQSQSLLHEPLATCLQSHLPILRSPVQLSSQMISRLSIAVFSMKTEMWKKTEDRNENKEAMFFTTQLYHYLTEDMTCVAMSRSWGLFLAWQWTAHWMINAQPWEATRIQLSVIKYVAVISDVFTLWKLLFDANPNCFSGKPSPWETQLKDQK